MLAAGVLDPTFGGDGIVTTHIGALGASAYDLAILPDGRLVAAGSAWKTGTLDTRDFAVARYLASGALDPTFGGDGIVTTDFRRNFDHINAVVVQADGKTIAAGATDLDTKNDSVSNYAFALVRYNVDGSLDTSFGGRKAAGKIVTDLSSRGDAINDVILQADGKILTVGNSFSSDIALARYHTSGTLDTSFGVNGVRILDLGGIESAQHAVIQRDGKIVIVGETNTSGSFDYILTRFDSAGNLDPTFGAAGIVTKDIVSDGISLIDRHPNLALQTDGKFVVVGDSNGQTVVGRYNVNGSPDTTFGSDLSGWVLTGMSADAGGIEDPSVVMDANGRIVVSGSASSPDSVDPEFSPWDLDISLARYLPDGSLDSTFGINGVTTTDVTGTDDDQAHAVALDADGRILMAGYALANGDPDFLLLRYQGGDSPSALLMAAAAPQGATTQDVAQVVGERPPAGSSANTLRTEGARLLLAEAVASWSAAGEDTSALGNVTVQIADLADGYLGMAGGSTIWLDNNASGWGWFVDATPSDDSEFTTPGNQGEKDRMDLLTVVMHELGHLLGQDHDAGGVMAETLAAGKRRTESEHDHVALEDQLLGPSSDHRADAWLGAWLTEQFESTHSRARRRW